MNHLNMTFSLRKYRTGEQGISNVELENRTLKQANIDHRTQNVKCLGKSIHGSSFPSQRCGSKGPCQRRNHLQAHRQQVCDSQRQHRL
jgi:hypothetical protein